MVVCALRVSIDTHHIKSAKRVASAANLICHLIRAMKMASTEEYQNAKAILKGGTKKMNKAIEIGRLTRDPEVRYSQGSNTAVARYTVAVDRKFKREGEPTADFIPCVAFGKQAEFAEKYFRKGTKVVISGRTTTGSYTNKDGQKIYTTEITVEEQEFAESKGSSEVQGAGQMSTPNSDGFMSVPDDDTGLPFN